MGEKKTEIATDDILSGCLCGCTCDQKVVGSNPMVSSVISLLGPLVKSLDPPIASGTG